MYVQWFDFGCLLFHVARHSYVGSLDPMALFLLFLRWTIVRYSQVYIISDVGITMMVCGIATR